MRDKLSHAVLLFLLTQHLLGNHPSLQIYAETKDGQVVQDASNRTAPRLTGAGEEKGEVPVCGASNFPGNHNQREKRQEHGPGGTV